jgi:bifunctional non-homologous end joining protein LigD
VSSRFSEPTFARPDLPPLPVLLDFYRAIGPHLLPYVARRPLNLVRCSGERCFFQRNRNHPHTGAGFFGPPIREHPIAQKNGRVEPYLYVDSLDGLLACVETKAVEFHAWGCRIDDVERPDRIAIDLDPGEGVGFADVKEAAVQVRRSLDALRIESWPMLTGGKGVHVVIPVEPSAAWATVRAFAQNFCTALANLAPDRFTVALPKPQRRGRIFLDYLRNQRTATAIMPFSLRARPGLPVAIPVSWEELVSCDSAAPLTIADVETVLETASRHPDWAKRPQTLFPA